MNKLLVLAIVACAFSATSQAALKGAPFIPEVDARFNALESPVSQQAGNSGSSFNVYTAKAIIALTGQSTALVATPIVLPDNAIITQSYFYINTAITPSGATLAFQCLNANDVFTATDETGQSANAIIAGAETGTAATMLYAGTSGCTISTKGGTHTMTAGIVDLFVQYVVAN